MARPAVLSVPQLVQALQRGFIEQNFGIMPEHLYLPVDLHNLVTDYIEEQFRLGGVPEHLIDQMSGYQMHGMKLHVIQGFNSIATRDELP